MNYNIYGSKVPSSEEFEEERLNYVFEMGRDEDLRSQALNLQVSAERYRYGYQQKWCGIPIIRLPDDILALQELIYEMKPSFIVETGVARGGGLVFSASMMLLAGVTPRVLGIDIQIFEHAYESVEKSAYSKFIELWEGDSAGNQARNKISSFIGNDSHPGLLILDSDHSHKHVLAELHQFGAKLPIGSRVLVADTLIEELPKDHFLGRPWDRGNSPLTAINQFLVENDRFIRDEKWSRRSLISEFRHGVLTKIR